MTKQEELKLILDNSPYALPNDTSRSGLTASQIKEKFYKGLIVLYELFGGKIEDIVTKLLSVETNENSNIVNGGYDNETKSVYLTTRGGENISFSIQALIQGVIVPNIDDIQLDGESVVEDKVVEFHELTSSEIEDIVDTYFDIGGET